MKLQAKKIELTPPQILVLGFAAIILLGATLLTLPIAASSGDGTPFLDAFFTATSATCVTGLVVVDTGQHWSLFGKIVIVLLIQVGGLGFMTMSTLFAFVLRKRISLKERLILQEAMNQGSMEGIVRLIRKVIIYSLTIELTAAVVFTLRWSMDMEPLQALGFGLFHAISFFNNAGFDLFGLVTGPFASITAYADDYVINIVSICLIILGGLGFVVLSDLLDYRRLRRLSLHSKVVLTASGVLIAVGAVVIFIFEFTNARTLGALDWDGKLLASIFQSVTPRTAGANTLDIAAMRQATQFFIIFLMFIGASPGSTGGGIKTTTFTTLVGAIIAMVRGKEDIVFFHNRLGKDRLLKAITITMIALFVVIFVTMVLSTTEDRHFLMILFEVTSAFGTVGLSMGLTPMLSDVGKVMIALTMFIGRLGPLTLAYALGPKAEKELYRYPEGKITIG
ncbi:TrkH family potassium uptake protein [Paenibacillus sp. YYML68]|uniref:TrkH family potassium uptake protein n=1 Tax=Paenibacillus sp. YYML68 TaxID=2909250 RepID=UPI002490F101|nr:TrkH family potassium uptake protein [Paenibacillus sp. YYML68]